MTTLQALKIIRLNLNKLEQNTRRFIAQEAPSYRSGQEFLEALEIFDNEIRELEKRNAFPLKIFTD